MIANQRSRDTWLAKRCLNLAYINRLTKHNRKSNATKWYTSSHFQEAKKLLDIGCPQLEEGINYKFMGLKWYQGSLIQLGYYPGMNDSDYANWLRTISTSVPPADHATTAPPPSPDTRKMLPSQTAPTKKAAKELEKDGSNIRGLLMDLAMDGSGK